MFTKLAVRNVRRQIGNYFIYFITVAMTVAFLSALNQVIYNERIQAYAASGEEFQSGLQWITFFITVIVAFVLAYATSFMVKLRKREFGTYLTLGMRRKDILTIFFKETMLLCLFALGIGIAGGMFLYQGLMILLANLMEMDYSFASYSIKGLLFTVEMVAGMFLLSSVGSAVYLRRISVYDLIHGEKQKAKAVRHPFLWLGAALFSLGMMAAGGTLCYQALDGILHSIEEQNQKIETSLVLFFIGILLFHVSISKSLVNLLLRNRKLCIRGTNTFLFRQMSKNLGMNSIMTGILSLLISLAVIGANCCFLQKTMGEKELDRNFAFDILACMETEALPEIPLEEGDRIIEKYAVIEKEIPYNIYTDRDNRLYRYTSWNGEEYRSLPDTFIKESDFNRLLEDLGKEPVSLEDEFLVVANRPQVMAADFSKVRLDFHGKTYPCKAQTDAMPLFCYYYLIAVIPDEAAEGLEVYSNCKVYDLGEEPYDAKALKEALSYRRDDGSHWLECDYSLREIARMEQNSTTSVVILGILYGSMLFVFLAMAVLALKILSTVPQERRSYQVLDQLGASLRERRRTLFREIFVFFFLPFGIPMLLGIPTAYLCGWFTEASGYAGMSEQSGTNALGVALVMTAVYVLYFTATYLIARKNIMEEEQSF